MTAAWTEGWRRMALLALLTAVAVALRVHQIGRESFWTDEGTSVALASLDWGEFLRVNAFERANMVFYMAALKLWYPFTSSEAGVRMLSVVFAALSIPAMERLGRRLFSPAVGMTAALFLALHGFHVRYSQEARAYTLLVLLVILSTHFFADMLEGRRPRRDGGWYVVLMAAAVYTQFMALFMMLAQAASVLLTGGREARRRCLAAVAAAGALILPLMVAMLFNDLRRTGWIPRLTPQRLTDSLRAVSGAEPDVAPWIGALLLVALWKAARNENAPWLRRLVLWVAFPVGLSVAVSLAWPMVVARYFNVLVAPLVLLTAYAALSVPTRVLRVAVAALVAAALLGGIGRAWNATKQDWRHVSEIVIANAQPGDAACFAQPGGYRCFRYYARDAVRPQPVSLFPDPQTYWKMLALPPEGLLRAKVRGHRRVWVFTGEREFWSLPPGMALERVLDAEHRLVRRWKFFDTGVELWAAR